MPSGLRTHVQKNYLISTGGGIGGKYDGITVTETETVLFVGMKEWNSAAWEMIPIVSRHGNLKNGNFIATQNTRKATGICLSLFYIVISDLFIGKSKVPRRIFCEERIAITFVIPGKPLSKKKIQY